MQSMELLSCCKSKDVKILGPSKNLEMIKKTILELHVS